MKLVKHIGFAALVASASLAQAAEPFVHPDWANSAWYLGGGIGGARATIDQDRITRSLSANGSSVTAFTKDERDAPAYKLFVGRQLNRYLAIEGGYFDLGEFGFDATTSDGGLRARAGFKGVNLDLVGQLRLTERFSLLGRVGVNYAKTHTQFAGNRLLTGAATSFSERKSGAKAGLGLEYKFSEALAMRAEVERYRVNDAVGNRGDVDMWSLGLVYKLGRPATAPVMYTPAPAPAPVVETPAPAPLSVPAPASEKVSFQSSALFDFDKAVVKPEGKAALDALLKQQEGVNIEVMVTVGHTDAKGSDAYNEKLSLRRAEAVKAYLVSKGVDPLRVYSEGKGESQPVADNKTDAGRAENRRVTVEVVGTRAVAK
ncbi:OmpA family protein [Massilia sp. CF038]|uniref:OmpA family protein n=1 Tax=Massilia sp. CF038 TaxID=1881045 RepID=UPI00091EEBA9|nr:OmpA-OmpF porin, OOP family [Massilia sp. CF038]